MHFIFSPGHDRKAPGATHEGFSEFPETLVWAKELAATVQGYGQTAIALPEAGLSRRVKLVNEYVDTAKEGGIYCVAIEVHFNSSASGGAGCETLYAPGSKGGVTLATVVQAAMVRGMGNRDRGIKEGWYRMDKPGHVDYKGDVDGDETVDYFLKATKCPAVIIEPEFVQQKGNIITKRTRCCDAIARALVTYYGT